MRFIFEKNARPLPPRASVTCCGSDHARRVQLDLFYDYLTNVDLYPKWQAFLKERQPKTLIFWGQDDIFFTREGGEGYLKDVPHAEMHRLQSGHFAVEDSLEEIATGIHKFYKEKVKDRR